MQEFCQICGHHYGIGDWPFCPHGSTSYSVIGDEIPGGQVIENLGDTSITFYSKKAIRDEANRRGLRIRDQWAGLHDKYLSNWAAGIDAKTLEDKRILLSRGRTQITPVDDRGRLDSLKVFVRPLTNMEEVK